VQWPEAYDTGIQRYSAVALQQNHFESLNQVLAFGRSGTRAQQPLFDYPLPPDGGKTI